VRGAKASANLYSLIETAKANRTEPYRDLRHVFTEMPKARTVEEVEALLPTAELAARLNEPRLRAPPRAPVSSLPPPLAACGGVVYGPLTAR
jgi:hypothetical protein